MQVFVFQKTILSMFFIFREKILIIYNSFLILAQNLKRTLSVLYLSAVNYGRYTVDIRQIYVRYTIDKYRSTIGILPHIQYAERCPIALMGVHCPKNSDFFAIFLHTCKFCCNFAVDQVKCYLSHYVNIYSVISPNLIF